MLTPSKTGFTVEWDKDGQRKYETGVERAVLYLKSSEGTYGDAVAWNGLTSFEESPTGAESNPLYADDQKYLDLRSIEEFGFTIGAYMYPDEFAECDGSAYLDMDVASNLGPAIKAGQQKRKQFGFCCTTKIGNDIDQSDYGYKIHLCYSCTASPSTRSHQTENESPEATEMSWECTTIPVPVAKLKNVAHLEIDCTRLSKGQVQLLENALFGDGTNPGRFLTPDEVFALLYTEPVTTKIVISPTSIPDLTVGSTSTISVTEKVPADAVVTWASSDTEVATVVDGVVTGVAAGQADITASIPDGEGTKVATCGVSVVAPTTEG